MIQEFASKPFIQKALHHPKSPTSVLSFFLGIDMQNANEESVKKVLQSGSFLNDMAKFWFAGGKDYDALCQRFSDVVRDAGQKNLNGANWNSVQGKLSQLILCDQLTRNCFRGTNEAFQYDNTSLEIANELAITCLSSSYDTSYGDVDVVNFFYPSYSFFLILALMHSESLVDHKTAKQVLDKAKGSKECTYDWRFQEGWLKEHTEVIEKFGRYPHRNISKGRETTPTEQAYLTSPDLPGWAKSQA